MKLCLLYASEWIGSNETATITILNFVGVRLIIISNYYWYHHLRTSLVFAHQLNPFHHLYLAVRHHCLLPVCLFQLFIPAQQISNGCAQTSTIDYYIALSQTTPLQDVYTFNSQLTSELQPLFIIVVNINMNIFMGNTLAEEAPACTNELFTWKCNAQCTLHENNIPEILQLFNLIWLPRYYQRILPVCY